MTERPSTIEEAAAAVREHAAAGRAIRPRGGGTKLGWAAASTQGRDARPLVDLDTRGLNRIVEHNAGDFTAVVEAGLPLASAQAAFARVGQMLALDPPLGDTQAATIGGILATNDSGPMRHRYGGVRDLVLGLTVVLSDGTVSKSGGKVIKNVAGYDLAKLFTGSYGTLGIVVQVAVRLHPALKPATTATVVGGSGDPDHLTAAVAALARLPLEADSFDVAWARGSGRLMLRFAGAAARERATSAAARMSSLQAVQIVSDDAGVWAQQCAAQRLVATASDDRASSGSVMKVSARPMELARVLRAADAAGGTVVSRAALGLSWMSLPPGADHDAIRASLHPRACTILDGAEHASEPWPVVDPGALAVMQRLKSRFDPARTFRPGSYVGGI